MLEYEESRTEDIVKRLVTIGRLIHIAVIINFVILFLSFMGALGAASNNVGVTFFMALLGGIIGYKVGSIIASLFTVTIEWLAQALVAADHVIYLLKNGGTTR